jgi:excisionase family DNA binding protein
MKHKAAVTPATPLVTASGSAPVVPKRKRTVREVPTRLLRVSEYGETTHMSKSAVYKGLKNGEIPFVVIANQIRIPLEAVEKLVADAMEEHEAKKSA